VASHRDENYLLGVLIVLTLCSGLIDAVCYLGLGRVFTANMTGNVVVIGFALAGAPGFSVPATLTSLFVFLVGAVCGGRIAMRVARRSQLLFIAAAIEAVFVGAAAAVAASAATVAAGWGRYTTIAILAFAMGVRNSVIRRLAVPGLNTTVLTMTLTGLAADSVLAGGTSPKVGRQTTAVLAMLVGALVSAALYLHRGPGLPLAISASCAAIAAVVTHNSGAARELDKGAMKAT
jgi:uncharacterized membrane protein YoaK (UPF0700 family)